MYERGGSRGDFAINYGTSEIGTTMLSQILGSILHTGTSFTFSKDCKIYSGAKCLTSDLSLFDCQEKMMSDLFLFLLIHRNSHKKYHIGIQTEIILREIRQQSTLAFHHGSLVYLSVL